MRCGRCGICKHWEASKDNHYFLQEDYIGTCHGMVATGLVDIYLRTGWSGGVVDYIETGINFFCAGFAPVIGG